MKDFADRCGLARDHHHKASQIVRGITKEFLEEVEVSACIISESQVGAALNYRNEQLHWETFDVSEVTGSNAMLRRVQQFLHDATEKWIDRCGLLDPWVATVKCYDMNGRATILLSHAIEDAVSEVLIRRSSKRTLERFIKIAYEHVASEVHDD